MKIDIRWVDQRSRLLGYLNEDGAFTKSPKEGLGRPPAELRPRKPFDGSMKRQRYWKKVTFR